MNILVQVFLYIFLAHFDNKKWLNSFSKRYAIFLKFPVELYENSDGSVFLSLFGGHA